MSFPIPGNGTYPLYKSINTFSFYIYMCRWHNLHKHTHMHTQNCRTEKNISSATGWHIYQNPPRDNCAEIIHFQGLSAPAEWLPNIPVSWTSCAVQSHQPKPKCFSCIWPKSSHAALSTFHGFQKHLYARAQPTQTTTCISDTFNSATLCWQNLHTTRVCNQYVHFSNTVSCYSTFGSPRGLKYLGIQDNLWRP